MGVNTHFEILYDVKAKLIIQALVENKTFGKRTS